MGLKNLLIIVLVLWVGSVLWRRWQTAQRVKRDGGPERMVRCEQCGVYLPIGEAVARGDEAYACPSHSPLPRA